MISIDERSYLLEKYLPPPSCEGELEPILPVPPLEDMPAKAPPNRLVRSGRGSIGEEVADEGFEVACSEGSWPRCRLGCPLEEELMVLTARRGRWLSQLDDGRQY